MELSIPYSKTDKGWEVIRERSAGLAPAMRALLIMMDGKKPLLDALPALKALSLKVEDVHALVDKGLLMPVAKAASAVAAKAQPAARATVASAVQETPAVATPAPAAPKSNRSLAAAKFYALDQLGRILGHRDEHLRVAAREVIDHPSLMSWLAVCVEELHHIAGPDRAELFHSKTIELLPDELLPQC
ncbi:hypothetical protein [Aquabacterium sp.]|uniref:hypothetical protein n=1 Tax=Aquabacterium sp. TaxID=1872578 RepID=UPI0035AD8638